MFARVYECIRLGIIYLARRLPAYREWKGAGMTKRIKKYSVGRSGSVHASSSKAVQAARKAAKRNHSALRALADK